LVQPSSCRPSRAASHSARPTPRPQCAGATYRAQISPVDDDETDHLVLVGGHQHLRLAQVDGLAPGRLPAFDAVALQRLGGPGDAHGFLPGVHMDFGDRFGIAQRGRADGIGGSGGRQVGGRQGHEKRHVREDCKTRLRVFRSRIVVASFP
jgi:hypothetical protein